VCRRLLAYRGGNALTDDTKSKRAGIDKRTYPAENFDESKTHSPIM
jgi:hypothetical protein